LGKPERLH